MDTSLISSCLNGEYHWYSRQILELYLDHVINTGDFLRWFHMPNSSYLPTSECIANSLDPNYDYRKWRPGLLDGFMEKSG
ncbi:MAG: hypothetical protein ACR2OL_16515 [Anderseniella sp.]